MAHRAPEEASDVPPRAPRNVFRVAADISLAIALAGGAIPFGLHDPTSYGVNPYEFALSALALIALVGVVIDLIRPQTLAWPFVVAAFTWAAAGAYACFLPKAVVAARIGLCLFFLGYAALAATAWRSNSALLRRRQ